ncbi:MAG: DUF3465 domain-containing protein [Candidatus Woykebacteria bacterium]
MAVEEAFKNKLSGVTLVANGKVFKILGDDHKGTHHQRFVIKVPSGRTLLVSHNLERAYRPEIKIGDEVEVKGTYVWNKYGGLLHNTHHDDRNDCEKVVGDKIVCGPKHDDGWIVFVGEKDPHRSENLPQ